jgi:hypothetical protein
MCLMKSVSFGVSLLQTNTNTPHLSMPLLVLRDSWRVLPRFLNSSPYESNSCHRMLCGSAACSSPRTPNSPRRRPGRRGLAPAPTAITHQALFARIAPRAQHTAEPERPFHRSRSASNSSPSRCCSPAPGPPRYRHRKCRSARTRIDSFFCEQSCAHHRTDLEAALE